MSIDLNLEDYPATCCGLRYYIGKKDPLPSDLEEFGPLAVKRICFTFLQELEEVDLSILQYVHDQALEAVPDNNLLLAYDQPMQFAYEFQECLENVVKDLIVEFLLPQLYTNYYKGKYEVD